MDRRTFLALTAAVSALPGCGYEAPEEPLDDWTPDGEVDLVAFPCGVQVGDPSDSVVRVVVHTLEDITLEVVVGSGSGWTAHSEVVGSPDEAGAVSVELRELEADTVYAVVARTSGGSRSVPTRFRTALGAGTSRVLTLGATSCLGGNRPWPSLSFVPDHRLDAFFLCGDTIYADDSDMPHRETWLDALAVQGLRDVSRSTSLVAIWDDHETWESTQLDAAPEDVWQIGRTELIRALPIRPPAGDQLWRRLSWGSVLDVFILDVRGEVTETDYLSAEQLEWLIEGLSTSTATFKMVLTSVPISAWHRWMGNIVIEERWEGWPATRDTFLQAVRDANVEGLFFLAGDFHIASALTLDDPGGPGEDYWEILAGPAGSKRNPLVFFDNDDPERRPVFHGEWNWTKLTLDPDARTVTAEWVGDEGTVVDAITLTL